MNNFRNLLLSLLLLIITPTFLYSQTNPFTIELRGGTNISKIDVDNWKVKVGYRAEFLTQYYHPSGLYLQSGVGYNHRGMKYNLSTLNMDYIQIPLVGGASFSFSNNIIYNMSIGVYGAYGIGGKYKSTTDIQYLDEATNLIRSEYSVFGDKILKPFDFGLRAEVGMEYNKFILSIGLEQGFIDIRKNEDIFIDKVKNQNIFITLGYRVF